MAMSKPLLEQQCPIQCQFCETDSKIQWKCIDCDILMCQRCKDQIHVKFKGANTHCVKETKHIGIETHEILLGNVSFYNVKECCTNLPFIPHLAATNDGALWIASGENNNSSLNSQKPFQKVRALKLYAALTNTCSVWQ